MVLVPAGAVTASPEGPPGGPAQLSGQNWRPVAERGASYDLYDVDMLSADAGFAVGDRGSSGAGTATVQNLSDGGWRTMPLHNGLYCSLYSVDAVSPTDAWAFGGGTAHVHQTGSHTLTDHWDGHRWVEVRSGGVPRSQGMTLLDGSMTSSDDVWGVGYVSLGESQDTRSVIKHWDGSAWSRVPSPLHSKGYNSLFAVDGIAADDAWAVGAQDPTAHRIMPALLHWDGTRWRDNSGEMQTWANLADVDSSSSDDVWVVGSYFPDATMRTFTMHWDGSSWTQVDVPSPFGDRNAELLSVDALAPDDVWAVGDARTDGAEGPWYPAKTIVEHYDGTQWRLVHSPNPGSHYNGLLSVSMGSATDGWAVGLYGNGSDPDNTSPMYLHWNGSHWKQVARP